MTRCTVMQHAYDTSGGCLPQTGLSVFEIVCLGVLLLGFGAMLAVGLWRGLRG